MLPAGDDPADVVSYLWYHDHTMDETGINVYRGLAGLFLIVDDAEAELVDRKLIPAPAQEIPLLLQDRSFNADGTLFYDFAAHDGFLGDVQIVNGKVQPVIRVERRKDRLRFLNGANARMFDLRLSSGGDFLQIGADGCLLPAATARRNVFLSMAERADVIVDFHEVYLENWLRQDDGRGPGGKRDSPDQLDRGAPLMKFVVEGAPLLNDVTIAAGDPVRPFVRIRPEEATVTRVRVRPQHRGVDDQRPPLRSGAACGAAQARRHGALDPRQQERRVVAPGPHPPRDVPGSDRQRSRAAAVGAGQQGHRAARAERRGRGPHEVPRLAWQVGLPLPQHRARGHEDDGPLRRGGMMPGRSLAALLLALAAVAASCRGGPAVEKEGSVAARAAAPIPKVVLTAHDGRRVDFQDLIRDRIIVLSFGYVRCTGSCPATTATLRRVQRTLGDRVGREVAMLTVTLDPEHDTAEALAEYAADLEAGPGWTFLTGAPKDVDALRAWFGLVDQRDPDGPRTSHAALVVVGDAVAGRWLLLPGLGLPREITGAVNRLARAREQRRIATRG
jgi:protein SCO1/2